ncbi:MAG: hypothetical protein WCA11_18690 [Terracidiphilus sp.]
MKELLDAGEFLIRARRRLRFGEFSREPIKLLRLEWKGDAVECDWMMRAGDPWDVDLPVHLAEENQTLQALRDALNLRDIVFKSFPGVNNAELRMFRAGVDHLPELVMTGSVNRTNEVCLRVASVAMRAMLCGFRFTMAEGVLESIDRMPVGCS